MQQSVTQTYNSFSGVDMIVTFGDVVCRRGSRSLLHGYKRESAALHNGICKPTLLSLGASEVLQGSLIFLVFDRSALY